MTTNVSDQNFLNFGGNAGAMTAAQPARLVGSAFQVSETRPAFVSYTVSIVVGAGQAGSVQLLADPGAGPTIPTTVIAEAHLDCDEAATTFTTLAALLQPGDWVLIKDNTGGGGGVVDIERVRETVL